MHQTSLLGLVYNASLRSAGLTRQLLAFARKQTVSLRIFDLNDTVSGTLKTIQRLIGENIQLAWLPGPNVWARKNGPGAAGSDFSQPRCQRSRRDCQRWTNHHQNRQREV